MIPNCRKLDLDLDLDLDSAHKEHTVALTICKQSDRLRLPFQVHPHNAKQ